MTSLSKCWKYHLKPSAKVLAALNDMENSCQKTQTEKINIWITDFIYSFLTQFVFMIIDMTFDVILVVRYCGLVYGHSETKSTKKLLGGNDTCFTEGDGFSSSEMMTTKFGETFMDIPTQLDQKPILFYSLAFLQIPWLLYLVEFCESRHYNKYLQKVKRAKYIFYGLAKMTFICHIFTLSIGS